jgi:hypothetical protein
MTRRQATAFIDSNAEELQKAYDEQTKKLMQSEEFVRSAKNVEGLMFENIKATGAYTDTASRAYATYVRDMYVTKAAEMRMTPEELYKIIPYTVAANMPAVTAQLFSQEQIDQTTQALQQTPEFQNWFKASPLVNETGAPIVMYHATANNFSEFDTNRKALMGEGSFFSSQPLNRFETGEGANIMPVYLSLQNPKILQAPISSFNKQQLIKEGYDGVVIKSPIDGSYSGAVAFEPNQIKSVFNEGSWSPETANILKQAALPTDSQAASQEDAQGPMKGDITQHVLMTERGQRVVGKRARMSDEETKIIQDAEKKLGIENNEISTLVKNHKLANPPMDGWAALELTDVKIEPSKNGKPASYELVYKTIPYTFANDKNGDLFQKGTKPYDQKVKAIARKIEDEVLSVYERAQNGDKAAQNIIRQAGWYKEMRSRLRQEFGGLGDLFADLLGATSPNTPVRENWKNAVDVLRRASRGDFDQLMPKWVAWSTNVNQAEAEFGAWFGEKIEQGMNKKQIKDLPEYKEKMANLKSLRNISDDLLPKKESGKKYGFNGRNALRAMLDLWRVVKDPNADLAISGTAPKALNFSGNLIGFREKATIDVWAARLLQRLSGGVRIPSMAEGGVSGNILSSGQTTLQFGFGQDVFSEAVKLIRSNEQMKTDERLSKVNDDDLQAIVWFLEKEVWTKNDWTSAAGEGGSFEYEADLTGQRDIGEVVRLRKIMDSSKSTQEQKNEAADQLNKLTRTVDRYTGGLSIQQSVDTQGIDFVPSDADMAMLAEDIKLSVYEADDGATVLGSKALSTEGRYGGVERSLDLEVVTRSGFNPLPMWLKMLEAAMKANQDSTFLSRVLRHDEKVDPLKHRPGVEIYFREGSAIDKLQPILDDLAAKGVEFYTVIVDGKRSPTAIAGGMPNAVGVRFQYVPEMNERYGLDDVSWATLTDDQISTKINEQAQALDKLSAQISSQIEGVSFAGQFWYETEVAFKNQYQEKINEVTARIAKGESPGAGGGVWSGESVRQGVEGANNWARESAVQSEGKGEVQPVGGVLNQSGAATGTGGVKPLRAADLTTTTSYGQGQNGSSSVVGIHYSRQPRTNLTGYYYGTGLAGAEKQRLEGTSDDRLRNRIHFYVDEGQGVRPESGVGGNVHSVNLNNLYNVNKDPLGLRVIAEAIAGRDESGLWFNTVESTIIDSGFDGVYVPSAQGNQGVAVLLGPQHQSVPVDQNGTHAMPAAGAFEAPATGKRKYSLLSSEIKKFQAQEAEIKAAAPSAELVNGSLVFDDADLAAITEFFPPAAKAQQLRQEMRGGFDPTKLTTILTEKSDYSTFLHETAHFYLTALFKMAEMPTATEQMKSDVQTILDWFGVKDLATWNAMSLEQQRKYHERWAYNHEIYVFEGKAPSIKLQTLFDRFSAWLRRVYKSIKEDLNAIYMQEYGEELPILTGEVRQVMDRMLASDEQIAQAEQVRGIMPLYQTQAESGMDDAEWAAYQEMQRDSHDTAVAEMTTASLRQMKWLGNARSKLLKEIQKKNADIRKDVRAQVAAEVAAEPLYRAMNFIKRGERLLDDGTIVKTEGPHKISIDALVEMYAGDGDKYALFDWSQLGYGKYGMVAEEGLHPDFIAEQAGFQSGDEMVRALVNATPMKEAIDLQTDQRMLEQYGDLNDAKAINTAVEQALHNEARARFVAVELRHAAKATQPVRLMLQAAKNAAKKIIGGKLIRNVKASEYSIAEQRANKDAMNAMKKGNAEAVTKALQNRLLNNQLTAEASKVTDEVAEGLRYFKKVQSDRSRQRVGADYSDQIDSLLERFELKPISLKAIDARTSLANWVQSQMEAGYSPEIAPELLAEANRMSYKNLTVDQFRDLVDAVKTIEHMGRTQQDMLTSAKKVAYETARNEIVESINANAKNRVADTRTPNTALGRYAQSLKRFWASHIKAATVSRILDGGKDGGAMWEYFIRSANERGDKETTMRAEATTELTKIMQPIFKQGKMGGKGIYFPTLGMSLNKEARIAIALNTGNAGNLQRLLGGEGWTLDMVMPVLQSLTKQELEAVQKIWDYFETYRPEIAAKERRIYGKEPKWVDPTPMTITSLGGDDVEMRGGYYPIVYDPMASERAEAFADAQDIKQQMQGAYTSATTRRSFTKSRVEEVVGRPLLYTLGGMYNGINDVIHDLSWHEWLIDANKLLKSQSIDKAIRTQYGPEFKQQLKSWVNDVAVGERAAQQAGEIALNRLRQGVSAAGLGFNVMSAMQQITGFNQSIVRVGPKWIGRGIIRTLTNGTRAFKLVDEASPFMANRARTQFRELNELRNMVQDESSAMRAVKLGAYFMMMRMQRLVDVPTFLGAYEKAIAAGNDEARAIALGDQAVIDSQGGGMLKDLSAIERGGPALKIFTVFYSYMNTVLNLATTQTMTAESKGKLAADYLMLFTVPVILTYALKKGLVPSDDDDEFDMEKIGKELIAEQISYLMGTMIITREFSEAGKLILGTEGGNRSYSGPGGLRLVSDSYNLIKQIGQGEFDTSFRKAAINVIGGAAGLPSAQINRTWNGIEALVEGKTENLAAPILGFQGR